MRGHEPWDCNHIFSIVGLALTALLFFGVVPNASNSIRSLSAAEKALKRAENERALEVADRFRDVKYNIEEARREVEASLARSKMLNAISVLLLAAIGFSLFVDNLRHHKTQRLWLEHMAKKDADRSKKSGEG